LAHHPSDRIALEICGILSIDTHNIRRLDILLRAGGVAEVEVERFLDTDEIEGIKGIISKYKLVEKEGTDGKSDEKQRSSIKGR